MYLYLLHNFKNKYTDLFWTLNFCMYWDSCHLGNGNWALMKTIRTMLAHPLSNNGNLHKHRLGQTLHPCEKLSSEVTPEN